MPDYNRSNTVEDLLRKYNLDSYQKGIKRIYEVQGELTHTNGILEDFVDKTTENMDLIKDQLDGNVTSWFYGYVPTLLNVPASNWITDDDKKEHLEDLFYNTDTGKVYKFVYENNVYSWIEVTNIVGAQALAIANASQDVIDGNRRVFVVQPTPPYDIGDVWADNTNHILYRCKTGKATGETFNIDDWLDSLNYLSTDDGDKLIDSINNRTTTKTISANKLFVEGDVINMSSKDLTITSDHFNLSNDGKMVLKNNYTVGTPAFKIIKDGTGETDRYTTMSYESVSSVNSTRQSYLYPDELSFVTVGAGISRVCYIADNGSGIYDISTNGHIYSANGVCQGSLEELKTDFRKLPSGLDIIRDIDIYKFKYKDGDGDKDHIGFVIGDKYKYSKDVTNDNNDGVDLYSYISVCCKAIQEQQEQIEELKKEIQLLKKEDGKND